MPTKSLIAEFDAAMMGIYHRALSETKYRATRYLHMLHQNRGVLTAQILIRSETPTEGYVALWERGRLDLTVEALIHDNPRWHALFSIEELEICESRLRKYKYIT